MSLRDILRQELGDAWNKDLENRLFDQLSFFISGCVQHTRDQVRAEVRRSIGIEDEIDRCPRTGFKKDGEGTL